MLLVSFAWVLLALYLPFRGVGATMVASGPTGGLIGFTPGALIQIVLITFGPPVVLFGVWRRGRRGRKPPAV